MCYYVKNCLLKCLLSKLYLLKWTYYSTLWCRLTCGYRLGLIFKVAVKCCRSVQCWMTTTTMKKNCCVTTDSRSSGIQSSIYDLPCPTLSDRIIPFPESAVRQPHQRITIESIVSSPRRKHRYLPPARPMDRPMVSRCLLTSNNTHARQTNR